ncbi:MAG: hypothetical protein K0M64_04235 [Rhizobium sp.]|nr:hypothetical protein [Rhizobium sp.]
MGERENRPRYRKLVISPDHGNSPFLWNGDMGGVVADGAYFYGPEPMSYALWRDFAEWMRGFTEAVYAPGGPPASWSWTEFHRVGLGLAERLRQEVGPECEVVYRKPEEDMGPDPASGSGAG